MKKGYYIHFEGRQSIGVSKKMDMQIEEFGKHFAIQELEVPTLKRSLVNRILGLLPTMSIGRDYGQAFAQLAQPDFLYVRRTVADRDYLLFWKKVKESFPDCKIIIELFTYPYDRDEFAKWDAWPFYIKERLYRPRLKRYVDRFVTYTEHREVFGIPAIHSANGIHVEAVKQVEGDFHDGQINLIGVAFMQRHHGYERIIEGLRTYYSGGKPDFQVKLRLVGDGPEKARYQDLVKKYRLGEYVSFYPTLNGKELDDLYNESDIALVSFGMYKLGFYGRLCALKSRECLAKGMPLITGCTIDVLPESYPYAKVFANDESPVDIGEVVGFYKQVRSMTDSKRELSDKIRQFAAEHVSMEAVMKPVVEYILAE